MCRPRATLTGLAIVAVTAGCGGSPRSGPPGAETVALSVTHRSEWRELWIEGATDLPDGAVVNYSLTHEVGAGTPAENWPAPNLIDTGRATVKDGQYWTRVNTLNWPPGDVRILVQFPLPPQPAAVESRYGAFGERLTGDNVTSMAGLKAVEVEYRFEHRP